jgi:hypothetical protein
VVRHEAGEAHRHPGEQAMKLIAYKTSATAPDIRPAPATRDWMDKLPEAFAYRCLPLNIANSHGWEIGCPRSFSARWDGGGEREAITVTGDESAGDLPSSHFGHGVLTFGVSYLFRSPPGINMFVSGPPNQPKHGIAPLSGIIETDWSPYSFTMNWKFTAPNVEVTWKKGEAYLFFFPLQRDMIETVEPEIRPLESDPELADEFRRWHEARLQFNREMEEAGSPAQAQRWQKHYYRGIRFDGGDGPADHKAKLRLKDWKT